MAEPKFKTKKNLTKSLIKFVEGVTVYVKIQGAMFIGKEMKGRASNTEAKKEPATLCDVVNLETGEEQQIILHAVVKSVFADEYPNDSYIGKGFSLTKMGKEPGKTYNKFKVEEIELPEDAPKSADTKKK